MYCMILYYSNKCVKIAGAITVTSLTLRPNSNKVELLAALGSTYSLLLFCSCSSLLGQQHLRCTRLTPLICQCSSSTHVTMMLSLISASQGKVCSVVTSLTLILSPSSFLSHAHSCTHTHTLTLSLSLSLSQ